MDLKTPGGAADRRRAGRRRAVLGPPPPATRIARAQPAAPRTRRRASRHLLLPDAARRQRPRRLDQLDRDRPHRRAARRLTGRGLRRRQLLRPVLPDATPALRSTCAPTSRAGERRTDRVRPAGGRPPVTVPRPVRAGTGGARDRRRRPVRRASPATSRRSRSTHGPPVARRAPRPTRAPPCPRRATRRSSCCAAPAGVDPLDIDAYLADGGFDALATGAAHRPDGHHRAPSSPPDWSAAAVRLPHRSQVGGGPAASRPTRTI